MRCIRINEKTWCVYMHTAPNGKRYIGITCKAPKHRWNNGRGYQRNQHFSAAIAKYGWDNFEHAIIADGLSKNEACSLEQQLIKEFKTQDREFGYNKSSGGELSSLGVKYSIARRAELSERMRGENNPNFGKGKKPSLETRKKMSEAQRNIPKAPEHRLHLSVALTGKEHSAQHNQNVSDSMREKWQDENYRAAMVAAHSGHRSHKAQRVLCVETGEIFECIKYACEKHHLHSSAISNVCRGKLKTTGGFHWKHVD